MIFNGLMPASPIPMGQYSKVQSHILSTPLDQTNKQIYVCLNKDFDPIVKTGKGSYRSERGFCERNTYLFLILDFTTKIKFPPPFTVDQSFLVCPLKRLKVPTEFQMNGFSHPRLKFKFIISYVYLLFTSVLT